MIDLTFIRKALTVEEAKEIAEYDMQPGTPYVLVEKVVVPKGIFNQISDNLFTDISKIVTSEGGHNGARKRLVTAITNGEDTLYVDRQGYNYARYIGVKI